jgi:Ran GTPase-activating protein (RanGAP) involved in mRNA processing and transport
MNFTPNCGDKEAQLLAAVLRENTTIQSLDLSVNAIQNEGAMYLAQALRGNRTLRKLKLCHNMIGAPGTAMQFLLCLT